MFSFATAKLFFAGAKKFITPTTVMIAIILSLLLVTYVQHVKINGLENDKVTLNSAIDNNKKEIARLEGVNASNQEKMGQLQHSNGVLSNEILKQNDNIHQMAVNQKVLISKHNKEMDELKRKYDHDIGVILATPPPTITDFDCAKDKARAIDAINAIEFLLKDDGND